MFTSRNLPAALCVLVLIGVHRLSADEQRATRPYGDAPLPIPGKIEAEHYDRGAAGQAYHDVDEENLGADYREPTQVDIEKRDDASGGHGIGWTRKGEWLIYTVKVTQAGDYTLEIPVASNKQGGTFHLEFDGKDVTGPIRVPDTGGWQTLKTIRHAGVSLQLGTFAMKLVMDAQGPSGSIGDIDFIRFLHTDGNASTRPNIVVILADDMGYGDVQALNPDSKIPTPRLNELAADGMTFTDAHTPSAVCTPTRYGLVTGRYCWRTRLTSGVLNGYGEPLMDSGRQTIAEFLSEQGYHTGIVGKWHLGLGFAKQGKDFDFSKPVSDGPHTHGFAFSHIIPASLDFPPYVYIRNGEITEFPSLTQEAVKFPKLLRKGERSPDLVMANVLDDLAKQAGDYIARQSQEKQPFFLYVPLTAPHKPVWPHPRFVGATDLGPYGDFVSQVDSTVGNILQSIDEAGVREQTLVIYTSDNGSFMRRSTDPDFVDHVQDESVQEYRETHHTANGPFRGTKADIFEAGHHVPFFARWLGKIEPGSQCAETICLTDVFRTAADIVGAKPQAEAAPDSFSLWSLMQGRSWETPRAPVIHHSAAGMFAIRDGKWKLILGNGSGGRAQPKGSPFEKPYQLYDVSTDVAETTNLIDEHPDVAERLTLKLETIRESGTSRE